MLFRTQKFERLNMVITRQAVNNESARMNYLANEANGLDLGGSISYNPTRGVIEIVLEGESGALRQFVAFAQASFGSVEQVGFAFEPCRDEFDFVQVT